MHTKPISAIKKKGVTCCVTDRTLGKNDLYIQLNVYYDGCAAGASGEAA